MTVRGNERPDDFGDKMKQKTIGIFDSGIGGLTVLYEAMRRLPGERFLFDADTEHAPYGTKEEAQVSHYADAQVRFLLEEGAEGIVVACNTATAVAIEELRAKYRVPLVGMEPAVKPALQMAVGQRVLVLATPITVREKKLHHLLEKYDEDHRADSLAMPGLVDFAEREEFDSVAVKEYLKDRFAKLRPAEYGVVVLGCTHFGYFRPALRSFFAKETQIIDGNAGTIRQLARVMGLSMTEEPVSSRNPGVHVASAGVASAGAASAEVASLAVPSLKMTFPQVTYFRSGKKVQEQGTLDFYARLYRRLDQIS